MPPSTAPHSAPRLVLTGERTLPGIPEENYWFRRHEAAYRAVRPFTRGARVLEAGCGEGYGAALLADEAREVLAVELDPVVIGHAGSRYRPRIHPLRADLQRLPIADASIEVVAALQVIEHLADQPRFLAECARVLRPVGTLLVTTPNRVTFSPDSPDPARPRNPFHTRELTMEELEELLGPSFVVARRWGLHHGRRLAGWERRHGPLMPALLAGPPDTWSPALTRRVRRVRAGHFRLRADRVTASLDLVVVAVRRP